MLTIHSNVVSCNGTEEAELTYRTGQFWLPYTGRECLPKKNAVIPITHVNTSTKRTRADRTSVTDHDRRVSVSAGGFMDRGSRPRCGRLRGTLTSLVYDTRYPPAAAALHALGYPVIIDGEAAMFDRHLLPGCSRRRPARHSDRRGR